MRPVAEHIRTLLFEHDYVTIPNFGAFIANYLPSSFNEISGSLMPPQKRVAFNEILKQDDGLLATHISRRESLTIDEAKRKIQGFVTDIKDSLATDKTFSFEKIGNFSLNEENNLVFDPDRRNNFFSESFGFDSIFPRQIAKEKYTFSNTFENDLEDLMLEENSYSTTHRKSVNKSGWTYALYSLPILLLSSGLFIVLFSSPKTLSSPAKASFNPLDYLPKSVETAKPELKPIVLQPKDLEIIKPSFENKKVEVVSVEPKSLPLEAKPTEIKKTIDAPKEEIKNVSKPVVETKSPTIITVQKRYLIVSGVFKSAENVEKLQAILRKNGFSPRIEKAGGLMKVIAAESDSYPDAVAISERHKAITGEKAAILKGN